MAQTILVTNLGGPEVLKLAETSIPNPEPNEVTIRQTAIGVNYIDTYHRSGLYPVPQLPMTPGMEAVGIVTKIGGNIRNLRVGDRVCYGTGPLGSYAEYRTMPASTLLKVPDALNDNQVAGMMLAGLTSWYLIHQLRKLTDKDTVLFHAAAGSVGLIFCQWASALGVRVIGTVGSVEKAAIAKANGCEETILYKSESFSTRVKELTNERGVSVVYDGVGKDTFMESLDCLQKTGLMVSFGNSSGAPPSLDIGSLGPKGSLFVTRPSLFHYTDDRSSLEEASSALFARVQNNTIKVAVNHTYNLGQAANAHQALEARQTSGSVILEP
ncbi:MAG: quinone oxidoreductase [Rhodospirillaceae bacterium]|nr:quinone oxidoreductase [Rhodospirillaceae bacterium]